MQVLLDDILIAERVRTEIGDLKPLMRSLEQHGQLNAITLTRQYELIAGHRRTLAARELGWKSIEAHIVDQSSDADKLQLELEENVHRKDFSPEELLAGYRRLDKLLHPSIAKKFSNALKGFFSKLFRIKARQAPAASQPEPEASIAAQAPQPPPENHKSKSPAEPDVIGNQFGI